MLFIFEMVLSLLFSETSLINNKQQEISEWDPMVFAHTYVFLLAPCDIHTCIFPPGHTAHTGMHISERWNLSEA